MPDAIPRPAPRIPLEALDFVDLWKYFESRGQELKTAMLSMITWLGGFAAAVLAFAMKEAMDFKTCPPWVSNPGLLIGLALTGLAIVWYSLVIVYEYADHINRTFNRSDRIRLADSSLDAILGVPSSCPPPRLPNICRHARDVMLAFGVAFAISLLLALWSSATRAV